MALGIKRIPAGDAAELRSYRMPRQTIPGLEVTEFLDQPPQDNARGTALGRRAAGARLGIADVPGGVGNTALGTTVGAKPAGVMQRTAGRAKTALTGAQQAFLDIGAPPQTNAARFARGGIAALGGAVGVQAIDSALAPTTGFGAPRARTVPVEQGGVDAIPTGSPDGIVAAALGPRSFFRDTEIGRNVGNAVNALGASSAAARGIGGIADVLRGGSQRVAQAGTNVLQAAAASNALPLIALPAAAATGEQPIVVPDVNRQALQGRASLDIGGFERIAPGINRKGSYYTDDPLTAPTFGVSSIEGGAQGMERNLRAADIYRGMREDAEARGNAPAIGFGPSEAQRTAQKERRSTETSAEQMRAQARSAAATGGRYGIQRAGQLEDSADRLLQRASQDSQGELAQQQQGAQAADRSAARRNALDIAQLTTEATRYSADRGADARMLAAESRAPRFQVIDQGDVFETDKQGLTQRRRLPQLVIDERGQALDIAGGAPAKASRIAADPRAIAIRDDPKLSTEEKRRRLQVLGYQ